MKEIVVAWVDRFADAERRFVPNGHRGEKRPAFGMLALSNGECGGNNRRCRVDRRSPVNVVEFEDVRCDAIGKRGRRRRCATGTEHGRFA